MAIKYRKVDNTYILRLDKGQEITSSIKEFCKEQDINAGSISGIGVVENPKLGYFNTKNKQYKEKVFKGDYEITSLSGNISYVNNDLFIHLHITLSDGRFNLKGGHFMEGKIGLTGEIFIQPLNTRIDRIHDSTIGLNIMNL